MNYPILKCSSTEVLCIFSVSKFIWLGANNRADGNTWRWDKSRKTVAGQYTNFPPGYSLPKEGSKGGTRCLVFDTETCFWRDIDCVTGGSGLVLCKKRHWSKSLYCGSLNCGRN